MRVNKLYMVIVIFLGMLLSNAAALYAAEEAPAVPAANTSEDQTAEEMLAAEAALEAEEARNAGPAESEEEVANNSTNPLETNTPAAAGGANSADEDFVPTIQISEDLSVSFPVDI